MHPFVIGELALGHLRQRRVILGTLRLFPSAIVARPEEVLELIDIAELAGIGIGYVDAHLLASVKLTRNTLLATRDRRLRSVAERLGLLAHFD